MTADGIPLFVRLGNERIFLNSHENILYHRLSAGAAIPEETPNAETMEAMQELAA